MNDEEQPVLGRWKELVQRLGHVQNGAENSQKLPSMRAAKESVDLVKELLFPRHFGGKASVKKQIKETAQSLTRQTARALAVAKTGGDDPAALAEALVEKFLQQLPEIRAKIQSDTQAAFEGDPALLYPDEALLCYPGIQALIYHRIAHTLHRLSVPLLPRMIAELAHTATGIDIHPGASIGEGVFIDHGTGVVVGETAVIGNRVRIYQGVTLGAKSFPLDANGRPIKGVARHPIVEDDVVIYSGATVLGRVTVGRGAVIGGNVWVTKDVPPGAKVLQAKAQQEQFTEGSGI